MTELELYKMLLDNLEDMSCIASEHEDETDYTEQLKGYVYATVDAYGKIKIFLKKQEDELQV